MTPDVEDILRSLPHYGPYVFSHPDGRPLSKDGVVHMPYHRAIQELAQTYPVFIGFDFHGLRHTFITSALERGMDFSACGDIVGHSTKLMTDRYRHFSKKKLVSEMAVMPRIHTVKKHRQDPSEFEQNENMTQAVEK